jgi:hypothetical protein
MDLKDAKNAIEQKIASNKSSILNVEKQLGDLNRGLVYLQGQLDLLNQMIKVDAEKTAQLAKEAATKVENAVSEVVAEVKEKI